MRLEVMKQGDKLVNVMEDRIVIRRKNGETDILFYEMRGDEVRIIPEKTVTIGFGNGETVIVKDGVTITTF